MQTDPRALLDAAKQQLAYHRSNQDDVAVRECRATIQRLEKEIKGQAKAETDKQAGQRMLGFTDDDGRQRIRLIDVSLVDPQEQLDEGSVCTVVEYDQGLPCVQGMVTVVALLAHEWEGV